MSQKEPLKCPRCGSTDKVSPCVPLNLGGGFRIARIGCDLCGHRWDPKDIQNPPKDVKKP